MSENNICYCDAGGNNQTKSDFYGSFKVNGDLIYERYPLGTIKKISTTNEAEYDIMIRLLQYLYCTGIGADTIIHSDSKIVVNQMNCVWRVKADNLVKFWLEAVGYLNQLRERNPDYKVVIEWVPREIIVKELGH